MGVYTSSANTVQKGKVQRNVELDGNWDGQVVYGTTYSTWLNGYQSSQTVYGTAHATQVVGSIAVQFVKTDGKASNTIITGSNAKQIVEAGGQSYNAVIYSGAQHVYNGGIARGTAIKGGEQVVSSGGVAKNGVIRAGASMTVLSGGTGGATVYNGGELYADYGGLASGAIIESGGTLRLCNKNWIGYGVAKNVTIKVGGKIAESYRDEQYLVNAGGVFSKIVFSEGVMHVRKGMMASKFTIFDGGEQHLSRGGVTRNAVISSGGVQVVSRGGKTYATNLNGGVQKVSSGGVTDGTHVNASQYHWNGSQVIYSDGKASNTIVNAGGYQYIEVGGQAVNTTVKASGIQYVSNGGETVGAKIRGGTQQVFSGATVRRTTLFKGGILSLDDGAKISDVTFSAGAELKLEQTASMNGTISAISTTASGYYSTYDNQLSLAKNASLKLGGKVNFSVVNVNASNACSIAVNGTGNTFGSLTVGKNTKISYNVSGLTAKGNTPLLDISNTTDTQKQGSFSINVKKNQGVGTYELSKNIVQAKNTTYTINQAGSKQGTAKLNGLGLIKGTAIYTVQSASNNISLTVAKTGNTSKGTAKADKITGTANWDVFYGGKGNDTITGKNGRDVAVYDTSNWGKDVIAKTKGSMTILFNGVKASQITQKLSGTTMTITKKSDKKQSITVQGWSNKTHDIVYGSGMTAFNKYLKAAKPTTAQTTAARNEVFKKAGLAAG